MILSLKPINALPEGLELSPWSQVEWDVSTKELRDLMVRQSKMMWTSHGLRGETIAVLGVHVPSEGFPELWALICNEFRARLKSNMPILKEHARFIMALYPKLIVRVDAATPLGRKFVEYMGFTPTSRAESYPGRDYYVYQAVN